MSLQKSENYFLRNTFPRNKRVLVRVDLNSDIIKGKLLPSERLTAPLQTIKFLQSRGCSIVLLAHQGRPGSEDFIHLKQHADYLKKYISLKYVPDVIGKQAQNAIKELKSKEVLLLDNVRTVKDELAYHSGKPNKLIEALTPLVDIYVNDAFSASHREHASIVGFPKVLPSYLGNVFEKELKAAEKLKITKALLILGGVKPDDYLELIEKTKGTILPTGFLGLLVLQAKGYKLGKEDIVLKPFRKLIPFIKKNLSRYVIPQDVAIELDNGARKDIPIEELPSQHYIYDVGIKTLNQYCEKIASAKTIFFKGLPGLCHTKAFTKGTERLLKETAASKAFSVVGGGHTLTLMEKLSLSKKNFGYVSLSGGALMQYLANGTLPGLRSFNKHLK